MQQFIFTLIFFVLSAPAMAWNAAGHRLTAFIAWQQLSPNTREVIRQTLVRHPDYEHWVERAHTDSGVAIFAEASTWPDDIRNDPRFYDEDKEAPTPSQSGLPDTARHKRWHYVDLNSRGKVEAGELDQQIERLSHLLRSTEKKAEISNALPWLEHLVADIHQPLHVGRHGDEGGNKIEIENPFNKRLPVSNLHTYWDDLPGPPWLRGKRLEKIADQLMANYPAPVQGNVTLWRDESHRLLNQAYPDSNGSLLPAITESFQQRARDISNRRIVDAGYRLGRLLESIFSQRVSRETPKIDP
ncbi:MAG: S1/P1 nuclease [Betaproteobacteria bacterium]|nr:S1/P1 nuclease [Betaproteobacteria bacterium]